MFAQFLFMHIIFRVHYKHVYAVDLKKAENEKNYMKKYLSYPLREILLLFNYTNPVYGVATIRHQVCCLRWGHPSLFHTATFLLI